VGVAGASATANWNRRLQIAVQARPVRVPDAIAIQEVCQLPGSPVALLPYIDGYKPRGNFQELLATAVEGYTAEHPGFFEPLVEANRLGDHVAAVPNRDVLLVTGADDAEGLQQMAAAAMDALSLPRPMCPRFYRLQGDDWVPL
jgi:hypothetical protein